MQFLFKYHVYRSVKYVLKRTSLGSKDCTKELKLECAYFLGQIASFCHLGFITDPLIVSKSHIETHDPNVQENEIYTRKPEKRVLYVIRAQEQVVH